MKCSPQRLTFYSVSIYKYFLCCVYSVNNDRDARMLYTDDVGIASQGKHFKLPWMVFSHLKLSFSTQLTA